MSDINTSKEDELDLLYFISILFKNRFFIIITTSIFMVGIVIYSVISLILPSEKSYLPNIYSPMSMVMLNNNNSGGMGSLLNNSSSLGALAGLAGVSGGAEITEADIARKLVTKSSFYNKLDEEFNLSDIYGVEELDYPITALRMSIDKSLLLTSDESSGFLEISYTHTDKHLATEIVNRITELLEEEFAQIDRVRNRNQYSVVEKQKKIVEKEISRLQGEIIEFQNRNNILDVNVVSNEITRLLSNLQSQLLQKEVAIESYRKISNIKDPEYIKLVTEKEALIRSIKKVENGEVGDYPPLEKLPILSMELTKLKSELDVQLIGYKAIVQQSETLKLTAGGTGPTFQVIEKAEVPEMKSGPSRGKLCIITTFLAFFGSLFIVFIKEALFSIIKNPDNIKRLKGEK